MSLRMIRILGIASLLLGALLLLIGLRAPYGGDVGGAAMAVVGASLVGFSAAALLAWLAVTAVRDSIAELQQSAAPEHELDTGG